LPETFKDAIKVCRHLSIHKAQDQDSGVYPVEYLWIDSLCIIQDNGDFAAESVKMYDYYGNAFITILGTSSQASDKGFLNIPHYWFSPQAMTLASSVREVRRAEDHEANWHGANTPLYGDGSSESLKVRHPTFDRGWIFQENGLARRTIHFTNLGVIYECRHPNINFRLRAENTALLRGTKDNFNRIQIRPHNSAAAYSMWHKCVEKYFPLSLGHESDRLLAIGGIAQRISQSLEDSLEPDVYLAGLWGRNIAAELCWRLDRDDGYLLAPVSTNQASSRDIHLEDYVAPSWSWASVRGSRLHITSTSRYFESMVNLETYDLAAKEGYLADEKGCFGKIQRCSITLVAPKREMRINWTTNGNPHPGSIMATGLPGEVAEPQLRVFIDTATLHFSTGHEANVHCILVGRDDTKMHGLVLTNALGSKGTFARVGYFRTDDLWEMDRQGQTFVETFEKTTVTII
jgi:hypothetical protein